MRSGRRTSDCMLVDGRQARDPIALGFHSPLYFAWRSMAIVRNRHRIRFYVGAARYHGHDLDVRGFKLARETSLCAQEKGSSGEKFAVAHAKNPGSAVSAEPLQSLGQLSFSGEAQLIGLFWTIGK